MRVSVGITIYNSERTIAQTIKSVFAQTFQDWELILAEDGSTDDSLAICRSIKDPRVRVLSDGENHGTEYRLNQINRLARGEYIARLDSDDLMHPERLARQVEYLDAHPDVDLVGCALYLIDADNNITGLRHTEPMDPSLGAVVKYGLIQQPSATARADWFRNNPYDLRYIAAEDHELWCRTCTTSKFAKLQQPLLYYRETHKAPWPYLKRYARHCWAKSKCYAVYGPPSLGWPGTLKLMVVNYAKLGAYALATFCGAQDQIVKRRYALPAAESDMQTATEGLQIIEGTNVPGMLEEQYQAI
ncbi:MAG: glycosyltransferase family 2 protein [Armatimonadota bacterium]|nr:glycosyltransferase family 2 protein [bacterium]